MVGTPVASREARQYNVYQSAGIAAAFSALSMRPSKRELTIIAVLCFLSASICGVTFWMEWSVTALKFFGIPSAIARKMADPTHHHMSVWLPHLKLLQSKAGMVRVAQGIASILVALSTTALWKALTFRALAQIITSRGATLKLEKVISSSKAGSSNAESSFLTENQRVLLGMSSPARKRKRCDSPAETWSTLKQRPAWMHSARGGRSPSMSSTLLVPVHPGLEKESSGSGCNNCVSTWGRRGNAGIGTGPSICPTAAVISPRGPFSVQISSYPMKSHVSIPPGVSPSLQDYFPSPWSRVRAHGRREIIKNEENLAKFLADVDRNILGSGGRAAQTASAFSPSACGVRGMGGLSSSPGMNANIVPHSGTAGSGIPPARVFPLFSKGIAPPKFKESELPGPMSLDQFYDGLRQLGIFESVDYWRDSLRQWFSSVLLKPLVHKLDTSHWQVMAGAAKLGIAINVGHIGSPREYNGEHFAPPATEGITDEWFTPLGPDEDALMHQLRAALMQTRDMRPTPQTSLFGLQCMTQEKADNPAIQECLDAVTEHQRLRALMKGDWGKGLLPLSSMRADYSVHRVRELADGTCARQFDWSGDGAEYSSRKLYNPEMPSDPHLMLYLFCALLEHPRWMLHIDPTEHPSTQWEVNPLYVAATPHKERIPEKYIAVLPHAPGYLHAGACVLCVGKQRPPVFALYWDRKLQFSFQGRSALWDAILLLCHRIKVAHGGVIRGIRLDSPALILNFVMNTSSPMVCS